MGIYFTESQKCHLPDGDSAPGVPIILCVQAKL